MQHHHAGLPELVRLACGLFSSTPQSKSSKAESVASAEPSQSPGHSGGGRGCSELRQHRGGALDETCSLLALPGWLPGVHGNLGEQLFRETSRWASLSWNEAGRVERLQTLLVQVSGFQLGDSRHCRYLSQNTLHRAIVAASLGHRSGNPLPSCPGAFSSGVGSREDEEQKGRCVQCCCKLQTTHPTGSTWREVVALTSSQQSSLSQSH